jgi:hypothetical protein
LSPTRDVSGESQPFELLLYPRWQFGADGEILAGLPGVISAAREAGMGPEELHFFVTEPEARLGGALPLDLLRRGWRTSCSRPAWDRSRVACCPNHSVVTRNSVRNCRRSWTDPIYRIQDDERISAWWYPEPRYRFDTPGEGAAVLKAPGMEAVKDTARRVPVSLLQRIGSQPVSSATRAGERDRLWPEVWSTTRKKSTRWC